MLTKNFSNKNWLRPEMNFSREEWDTFIDLALELKKEMVLGEEQTHLLKAKTLFTIFFNQSLRTRSTFATGIQQLGGFHVDLEPGKTYTPARKGYEIPYKTERISDIARILNRIGDAIAIRMYGPPTNWIYGFAHETMQEFAYYADIPVINMECDKYHPTQVLADLITIKEKFGKLRGLNITMSWAYSGSIEKPRAVPQSVILASALMGMNVTLSYPKGFELDPEVITKTKEYSKKNDSTFKITHDFDNGFRKADIVYPKSWGSKYCFNYTDNSGKIIQKSNHKKAAELNEMNKSWITTSEQMKLINKNGIYMHCLPADRGQEVEDDVIDGANSVVIDEAENRLHAHKAIMALLMK